MPLYILRSHVLEKHGSTDIGIVFQSRTVTTSSNFQVIREDSFTNDNSNINFKESYTSPKRFFTTLKLISL